MKKIFSLEDMYMLAAKVVDDIAANRMNGNWNLKMTPKMIADDFIENGFMDYAPAASPVPENEKSLREIADEKECDLAFYAALKKGIPISEGDKGEGWQRIVDFGASRIVDGKRNICSMFSESEEFASLVAAAPDMYDALKRARDWFYLNIKKNGKQPACIPEIEAILNRINNK